MSDNKIVSFSGGRSSGMMLVKMAEKKLLDNAVIQFADTGREHVETYNFVDKIENFIGVPIVRITAFPGVKDPLRHLILKRKFLPNQQMRICTLELKIIPMQRLMIELGHKEYVNFLGFRADEQKRIVQKRDGDSFAVYKKNKKIRQDAEKVEEQRNKDDYDFYQIDNQFPLNEWDISKRDVLEFWAKMPFDLETPLGGDSNCVFCFHKPFPQKVLLGQLLPEVLEVWLEDEKLIKATYNKNHSMKDIQQFSKRQTNFVFNQIGDSENCVCSD